MGNHYGRSFFRKWIFAYSRIKKAEKINLLPSKRLYFFHSFWKTMYVYWSFHLLCPITMSLSVFELKPKSKKFYFGKLPTAWKKTRSDQTTWQAHLLRILAWTLNSNQMWAVTNPLKAKGETSKSTKGVSNRRMLCLFCLVAYWLSFDQLSGVFGNAGFVVCAEPPIPFRPTMCLPAQLCKVIPALITLNL